MKKVADQDKRKHQINVWFTDNEYLRLRNVAAKRNLANVNNPDSKQENVSTVVREAVLQLLSSLELQKLQ